LTILQDPNCKINHIFFFTCIISPTFLLHLPSEKTSPSPTSTILETLTWVFEYFTYLKRLFGHTSSIERLSYIYYDHAMFAQNAMSFFFFLFWLVVMVLIKHSEIS
jgi:hypothetical protein